MNEKWAVGAFAEDTAEAKREVAVAKLVTIFNLEENYKELRDRESELARQRGAAYNAYTTALKEAADSGQISLDRIYIVGDKAVMVTVKKYNGESPGYGHTKNREYEIKIMELG